MELNKITELQTLSHKLVEIYPEHPISWYSVGCFYYMLGNTDNARKYLTKSTVIDPHFQPSLLMFGHTFEMESLHDQAMAVYLDLTRAMPRSFLPLLYVGIELAHMHNTILAEKYILQALEMSNNDVFVLHELGVVYYQKKHYDNAKKYFLMVEDILSTKYGNRLLPPKWEPLLNNLGHVCRKLGQHEDALEYHYLSLMVIPNSAATYNTIGLIYGLLKDLDSAMECFTKVMVTSKASSSLNHKKKDSFDYD